MRLSNLFIARPVATMQLSLGIFLAGMVAYGFLPVAAMPAVDVPTLVVLAAEPGASPETMADAIAAPLERRLGEISGVTDITSTSIVGSTSIVVQFSLDRDIDGAAHDVQAAINAAATDLPSGMPTKPFYRKLNPALAPIMKLQLHSDSMTLGQVYDATDTIMVPRLSQVPGVSQVNVSGAAPAVRVQLDPARLAAAGLSAEDVTTAIRNANVLEPTGGFQGADHAETIFVNGQISQAKEYAQLVIKAADGGLLHLADVASVVNGVSDVRVAGWAGKEPAVLLTISKEAGANVIQAVDAIRQLLPELMERMPKGVKATVILDRTATIRASVHDIQRTLLSTIVLVVLVIVLFTRRLMPIAAVALSIPLSLCGMLAGIWMMGFTLDIFSLMALTVAVGFIVDDAIVMTESIFRRREAGETARQAARAGAQQIGFTVISISVSLLAAFIPMLFMSDIMGRLFREFAVTLSIGIAISALVSLTVTPMICGAIGGDSDLRPPSGILGLINDALNRAWAGAERAYARSLLVILRHNGVVLLVVAACLVLTVFLYATIPKGFLPNQETGVLGGGTLASPDVSFKAMEERQKAVVDILLTDPAVASVGSSLGASNGGLLNRGGLTVILKPLGERQDASEVVAARLRERLGGLGGIQTFLSPVGDIVGVGMGQSDGSQALLTITTPKLSELRHWSAVIEEALARQPGIVDVSSDQDRTAPALNVIIDRDAAARLDVSISAIDDALNNAYSQRQISTIYTGRNQYKVVMETDPGLQTDPSLIDHVYVGSNNGMQVPLSAVARFSRGETLLAVRHQGQYPAGKVGFSPAPGTSLGTAVDRVHEVVDGLRLPDDVHVAFGGDAQLLQGWLSTQPILIGAAVLTIYIVLGVLYESLIHPLTILSTLPTAGLGALLALLASNTELSIIGMIGIILLMGIVQKNAILIVDCALEMERKEAMTPLRAIHAACLHRFRPIVMTTLAAICGALPLAFAVGAGSEMQRPLGIALVGGLIVSQTLTLYSVPAVYLSLERLVRSRRQVGPAGAAGHPGS